MSAGITDCGIRRVPCLYREWTELFSHVGMDISSGGVDSRTGIQTEKRRPDDVEGSQRVQEVTRGQHGMKLWWEGQCQVSGGQLSDSSVQLGSDSQAEQAPASRCLR